MQILLLGTPFEMQMRVQTKFRLVFASNARKSQQLYYLYFQFLNDFDLLASFLSLQKEFFKYY